MTLYKFVEDYIDKHGHSLETMESIIMEFKEAMVDHNIGVYCEIKHDYNDYNELKIYKMME